MTHNSNSHNENLQASAMNQPSSPGSVNTVQRDRFEMLSAYLDGEVTAAERRQVEEWLAHDTNVQRLHARLLNLRQAFQAMPVPASECSVQETVEQVFARVERRPRLSLILGGGAIAALFVGAIATMFAPGNPLMPEFVKAPKQIETTEPETVVSEPLLIALDRPLVTIPKAPVAQPISHESRDTDANPSAENVR
ncbi:zf-HC2 domain-containing protein [Leptothermofonsia sichuanensis E412]|uniref:anti-sigma factor family protein n=1 Tax=Leptothermofonsia sichuanensis TaxID=2917832 RepID=UPI001CA64748|nr:zf-HC2 domain-containing protein [Leptothermofonsia sichuanensis]QZZ19764.1 zf-HC2 domain-containing protein [Leptothermofonsia sichuanensis E412]